MGEQEPQKAKKHICAGLLAHVDAGKTTLSEGILYTTGIIRKLGRVDKRDAYLDTYELERQRGITIFSKQAVFVLGDMEVTLLDTPGHVDFAAEMERTLQVLDYAVLVVSGTDGVQGHTETLWRLLKRYQIPVFLFINKMDQPGTDKEAILRELREQLDEGCMDFAMFGSGADGKAAFNLTDEQKESLALCDELVLERYLEEGEVSERDIRNMILQRKVFPCYFGSALKLQGVEELLNGMERWTEAPNYGAQLGAKVFKISRDNQGNRLTHLKVTGGSLKVREMIDGKTEAEKITQIRVYSGAKYEVRSEVQAGEICAVTGLAETYPGQGIGVERESELPLLEPVLTYRVGLPDGCDPHRLMEKLRLLEEEEPQLHIVWSEVTGEIQAQIMGEVQMEVLKTLVSQRFNIDIEFDAGSIVYKETILKPVEGVGHFEPLRHYAEVHVLLEPGEPGSGLQFDTSCSEDMLDRNWQHMILTHLEEKRHVGVMTGTELTDVRITLTAGRAHLKHTESGDFRQASYRAVRQGLCQAREQGVCRLLEPYYEFRLEIPQENAGRAMADLERMQAAFQVSEAGSENMVIAGSAPVATMCDYQREVISYTRGRGRFSCGLKGYLPCHNEEEVIAALGYDAEADLDNPAGSIFCAHGAGFAVPWYEVKRYAHVHAGVRETQDTGDCEGAETNRPQRSEAHSFGADDKELEEIFTRTYGERKRYLPGESGARQVIYKNRQKQATPEKEYLLVDGYNILYAWDELRELMKITVDGARQRLMDMLCNYQAYRGCQVIVVFDAYKVPGGTGSAFDYHNIHVVYTKEAETADQYIEKFAHEMGRKYRVTVSTSDGMEQLIIRGQGCLLMSSTDLREDMERVGQQIKEDMGRLLKSGKSSLFRDVDEELAAYLEKIRLGEEH